jgi:hypothetical protein
VPIPPRRDGCANLPSEQLAAGNGVKDHDDRVGRLERCVSTDGK